MKRINRAIILSLLSSSIAFCGITGTVFKDLPLNGTKIQHLWGKR